MYTDNDSLVQTLYEFSNQNYNIFDFKYIPAVNLYCNTNGLFKTIECKISNLRLICIGIQAKTGKLIYTSNDPYLAAAYVTTGIDRADNFIAQTLNARKNFLLSSELDHDLMSCVVRKYFSEIFNLYYAYSIIRYCDDCKVIVTIGLNYPDRNIDCFYKNTIDTVEDFLINYLDQMLSLYIELLPFLKYTRFSTDAFYRHRILCDREWHFESVSLSEREKECLYWLSRGKTAEETAKICNISIHTVVEHKKSIFQKLGVSNIIQAIYKCLSLKIIT